ncbi:N-acetylglucosamine-6-phosphate deacetylase [Azospirillum fermentarium]|uniref:N-acetylglucosamine-6-phosphate deacetylase n=1 Tax=Azospirillum fermentarium TaxID=1233114 RepID=UPI0022272A19|nr:N-acetylglucosamine-6-phosphate deacetylase [Azospirillum fermentarium]MCW2244603.1 N-acetylglucosamine-6-phosphate deacetylase [Azospirillum fermentarium]
MQLLVNAAIHTGDDGRDAPAVLPDGVVLIGDDGRILAVQPADRPLPPAAESCKRVDLNGGILSAGFIDLQVNGGGGVLFNGTPTVEGLRIIAAAHRRFGTTALLPTVITDSPAVRRAAAGAVAAARAAGVPGILGIHFEGPCIAPARRGVHDARFIPSSPPAADGDEADLFTSLRPLPVLVTLAPERVTPGFIRRLADAGVRVAAGHSAATWDQAMAGLAAGITGFTHLFNAMSPLDHREPGMVGAALDSRGSWCGIILDGHHVHDAAARLAWRAKPAGRLFLVTDAMPPVGLDGGDFSLYGTAVRVEDGRCVSADGRLAGSALDMATAVRNAVRRIGVPLDEALRMAAAYPADFMGLSGERGRIRPGLAADLVHLDHDLKVQSTWIAGLRQSAQAPEKGGPC